MKKLKKFLVLVVLIALLFLLTGCSTSEIAGIVYLTQKIKTTNISNIRLKDMPTERETNNINKQKDDTKHQENATEEKETTNTEEKEPKAISELENTENEKNAYNNQETNKNENQKNGNRTEDTGNSATVEKEENFDYLYNKASVSFIKAYNEKNPNEKITKEKIIDYGFTSTTIGVNDKIKFKISESDGEYTYSCYCNLPYSNENRNYFIEYVHRLIDSSIYHPYISNYEISTEFPADESYDFENKIFMMYMARKDGRESSPTFEVFISKKTW